MQTKYFDQILILLMAALAVFSGYQLYRPIDQIQSDSAHSVAEIISQVNTVKTKRNNWLAWLDSNIGFKLSENDMIYTHADSSAEIELNDGSTLSLAESTLFKVSGVNNQEEFNLERGIVFAKLASSRRDLKVDLGGNKLQLSAENAEFQISKDSENQNISLLSGEMKIQNESGIQVIKENQEASFNGSQIKIKNIPLISLAPHKKTYYIAQAHNIHFEWQQKMESQNIKILIATDRKFKKMINSTSIRGNSFDFIIDQSGTYYWKLVGQSNQESFSTPIRFFQVYREFAPQIFEINSPLITFEEVLNEYTIQWSAQGFKAFETQLSFNEQPSLNQEIKKNSLRLTELKKGKYTFRVRGIDNDRPEALWSESKAFEVLQIEKLSAPHILSPSPNSEFVVYDIEQSQISFAWDNVLGSNSYRLELKSNNEVQSFTSQSHHMTLPLTAEGSYEWRLVALNDLQESSSEWNTFSVKIAKDNALSPQDGSVVELKRPDQDVTFEWKPDSKTQDPTYLLEVSNDPQFNQIQVTRKLKGIKSNVRFSKLGTYYWRTKIIKENGQVEFSRPTKVEVVPSPAPKPLELPEENTIEIQFEKETSLWNWFISPAYADGGFIELKWPKNEDAKFYKIEIFTDSEMKNKVLDKTVQTNSFKWNNVTEGQYFWRVAIVDHWDREGTFSNLSKLITSYPEEFFAPVGSQLITPKHRSAIRKGVEFEWSKDDKAEKYRFMLATDLEFKNIIFEKMLKQSSIRLNTEIEQLNPEKRYYWKVVSIGKKGHEKSSLRRQVYRLPNEKKREEKQSLTKSSKVLPPHKKRMVQSLLTIDALPSSISEDTTNTRTTTVSGTALNSLRLSYRRKISMWFNEYQAEAHRLSGEVFQNLSFSQIYLSLKGTRPYSWGNLSTGLNIYSINSYPVQTTVKEQSSTLFAVPIGVSKSFNLSSRWSTELSAHALLGTILGAEARAHFNYSWAENFDLRTGIEYSNLSFTADSNDVSVSRISLLLGISQLF